MSEQSVAIPGEVFFHLTEKQQSVDALFRALYERHDEATRQHFMWVNSHLGEQVQPGQLVIITPPGAQQCTAFEAGLMAAARRIEQQRQGLSGQEARVMARHYGLLSNIAGYSGAGYGIAINYFRQHKSQIEFILRDIEKLHVNTYNRHGRFNEAGFYRQRKLMFQRLDNTLKTLVGQRYTGPDIERGRLKRSLGLSTKSLFHQLKDQPVPVSDLPGFEKNYAKVRQYGKLLKRAGYAGLVLDGVQSVAKVHQACTVGREAECTKSKFSEGGRLLGSVGGGVAGGSIGAIVGYGVCNLVFGVPSGGTSIIWCGIVAGGAGGLMGGTLTGTATQYGGELLYEAIYR